MSHESADILIALNNFAGLGAQRVAITLANHWPKDGPDLAISAYQYDGKFSDDLDPEIDVYEIDDIQRPLSGLAAPSRVLGYYKLLKRLEPDAVLAVNQFQSMALCFVKRFYSDFRLVVSEHAHVSAMNAGHNPHDGWFGTYYRSQFPREYAERADYVHAVAHEAAHDFVENHDIPREKVKTVYYPVDFERIRTEGDKPVEHPWFAAEYETAVASCRLAGQKRLEILLRAWKRIQLGEEDTPHRLIICGDGPRRESLEQLAGTLGVSETIHFAGWQDNPWPWVRRADVFVSTSEWEGLPNSLLEAQTLGTPIVSSDCPSGPREILIEGEAGYLFESLNETACATMLQRALENPEERAERAATATANLDRFEPDRVVEQYVNLLTGCDVVEPTPKPDLTPENTWPN
ncbi:glycosyltransferase [Halosimplex amylolyticum]|uniref:glycosyltransferase n=1 Tax=Halosimplex amylolyticum TaxID=3396616 RepID=UPI003F56B6CE